MITLKHIELLLIGTFDSLKLLGMVLILFNVCLLLLGGHSLERLDGSLLLRIGSDIPILGFFLWK